MPFQMIAELLPGDSEAKLRTILQAVPDALIIVNDRGRILLANDQSEALFGYEPGELLGQEIEALIPARYGDRHRQHRAGYHENPRIRPMGTDLPLVGRRKDGREFAADINLSPLETPEGMLTIATIRDVSRQRDLERQLRWQATVIDQIHDSVVATDLDGYITSWNRGAERLFGYRSTEMQGQHISVVYPPEEQRFLQENVIKPLQKRDNHEVEVRMQRKSGQAFYAHLSLSLLRDRRGTPVGMIGFSMDIDQQKRATDELQVHARQQAAVARLGQIALSGLDLDALMDQIVVVVAQTLDVEYVKILELQPGGQELRLKAGVGWRDGRVGNAVVKTQAQSQAGYTLLAKEPVVVADLHTETRFSGPALLVEHGVASGVSVIIQGKEQPFGILGAHTAQKRVFGADHVHFLQAVAHVLATAVARKQAEAELWESEVKFRQLAENVQEVFWMTNAEDGRVLYVNPAYEAIWGRTRESLYRGSEAWLDTIHAADRERVAAAYTSDALKLGAFDEEYRVVRPDGSWRWIRDRGFPIYDEHGEVYRIAGIATDITAQRDVEEKLRHQAERLRALREIDRAILGVVSLQEIAQAVLHRLHDLVPCYWAGVVLLDEEALRATLLAAQMGGRSVQVSEDEMPLAMLGDLHAFRQGEVTEISDVQAMQAAVPSLGYLQETGVWSYCNVPLMAHDKLVGSLSLGSDSLDPYSPATLKMVREVADPLAIAIQQARLFADVEAARERLQLLSQRLVEAQETERRHLARELHDEIGQSLTVIKINLESLQRDASNATIAPRLQHSIEIVQHTLQQVRELSLDLRPALLDDLGLVATLRWYLDRQTQWNDFAVYFVAQPPDLTLPNDLETVCFRIVQEAMTNIIRHAQAQNVTVTLALHGVTLLLMIEDDGVGFDVSSMLERVARGESFGLSGMQERALLRDGQLTVDSAPGRGTTIEVTFDLPVSSA